MTQRKIVCLCGSTRHFRAFLEANRRETMAGNIVLTVGVYGHSAQEAHGCQITLTQKEKEELDELHRDKVRMADEIIVIGEPGDSTKKEVELASELRIPIRRMSAEQLSVPPQ